MNNNVMIDLMNAAKCALADLEGLLPDIADMDGCYAQTVTELRAALTKATGETYE